MAMVFGGNSHPAGSATPFQRTVEPSALGLFAHLEARDGTRLRRYEEAWRMYLGQHWSFTREDGEPLIVINYVRKIVDDGVSWLVGNGFSFDVPESMADVILPHLREVWQEHNDQQTVLLETAAMGGITGDVWVLVTPVRATAQARRSYPNAKTFIRIHVLGSESVFPVWDPLNPDSMLAVKVVTLYQDNDNVTGSNAGRGQGPPNISKFVQVFYPDKIVEQRDGHPPTWFKNELGEIPIVHIKNFLVPREFYGMGDMDGGLIDLQKELNEKATDTSDIINYHAHPITIITGAKVKNLDRSPKKVWSGLPQGATVTNLEMSGSPLMIEYMDRVERWMRETTDSPEKPGAMPGSGTSGVATEIAFLPTMQRVLRKKPSYERGLREINYFILRWKQLLDDLVLPEGFCKNCGGKIVDVAVKDRKGELLRRNNGKLVTRKRCFMADKHTGILTDPEDVKIRFVRQFSNGAEIHEIERWRLVAAVLNRRGSFWDPIGDIEQTGLIQTSESLESALKKEGTTLRDPVKPQPFTPEELLFGSQKLPEGAVQVPAEPELVSLLIQLYEPDGRPMLDGEGKPVEGLDELMVVPTSCDRPEFFNPLVIPCKLNDSLPRDEHREMQLAVQATTARLWSRKKALKRLREENPEQELEAIEGDISLDIQRMGSSFGGKGDDVPSTELQGTEQARADAFGSANVSPPSSFPMPGKNQGES